MTEAMTPEREARLREWERWGGVLFDSDIPQLLAALDAEREARQRAELHGHGLARIIDTVRDALMGGPREGLNDRSIGERAARVIAERDAALSALSTAIARAERAEAERDEAIRERLLAALDAQRAELRRTREMLAKARAAAEKVTRMVARARKAHADDGYRDVWPKNLAEAEANLTDACGEVFAALKEGG
jgi:hypothetical protein